jgi:two-component system, NtrC family, sensor kinase
VSSPAPGHAVVHLPWLAPSAAALAALARDGLPAGAWAMVRWDPGAVLLVLRHGPAFRTAPVSPAAHGHDPAILAAALERLTLPAAAGFADWHQAATAPIHEAALRCARLAQRVAEDTGRCDPDVAWSAGLLAPLGWLALCGVDATTAAACLADPAHATDAALTERTHWGLDHAQITRRLARRWLLPHWLAAVIGSLALPAEHALSLGADPGLFAVVQLAVSLAQERPDAEVCLRLRVGTPLDQAADTLGIAAEALGGLREEARGQPACPIAAWRHPAGEALLPDLLALAVEHRRLRDGLELARLEDEVDRLQQGLASQCGGETERLQKQKLSALAEFAAGAGHEINNPLAVISGQAQYLLRRHGLAGDQAPLPGVESTNGHAEPSLNGVSLSSGLETIIQQTQRIHHLLRDLMQFARPPQPRKQVTDLGDLVREACASLAEFAAARGVRIEQADLAAADHHGPLLLEVDPAQVRTALACLLRNAVEAAPAEGWAAVRVQLPASEHVEVIVEDNGPGLQGTQREHLFDPFYSGRQAGRGKGLGLPTAWRLARQNGGDVELASPRDPTRFLLRLPLSTPAARA